MRVVVTLILILMLILSGCGPRDGPFRLDLANLEPFSVTADCIAYTNAGQEILHVSLPPNGTFDHIVSPPPYRILVVVSVGGFLAAFVQFYYGVDFKRDGIKIIF